MATLDVNAISVSVSDWPGPNLRIRQNSMFDVRKSLKASRYNTQQVVSFHISINHPAPTPHESIDPPAKPKLLKKPPLQGLSNVFTTLHPTSKVIVSTTKVEKAKDETVAERQASLPLPEQPPVPSEWQSADARNVNVGSGIVGSDVTYGNAGGEGGLRGLTTADIRVRVDGEEWKANTVPSGEVRRKGATDGG